MATMLIVNAVLLLGVACESRVAAVSSSGPSDGGAFVATTRSRRESGPPAASIVWSAKPRTQHAKRFVVPYGGGATSYEDASQARSATNAIPWPRSGQTYSPYRFFEENVQSQNARSDGQARGEAAPATGAPPSLQGGFLASPEDGYPKGAPPYASQSAQNFRAQSANGPNQNSQYFANPSTYRHIPEADKDAPSIRKNSDAPTEGLLPKAQSFSAILTDRQYPSTFGDSPFNFPKFPKFRGPSALSFGTQGPLAASPQGGTFKSGAFSPTFSSGLSSSPGFKAFDKLAHNYLYGGSPAVGYSNKAPIPGPLPGAPAAPGFPRAFGGQQGLLGGGAGFQTRPASGLNFEFSKAGGSAPFSSIKGPGASAFASSEYAKPGAGYELLANQPQLHFTTGAPPGIDDDRQSVIYHAKPFEDIRTDVEVIDKKKPTTPRPDYSDEHDFDEGLKTNGDFDYSPDDPDARAQKGPERDTSYEVPSSNLFNSYDEAFGKYSKLASNEEHPDGARPTAQHGPKPVYQSVEEGGDAPRDASSEDYRSGYTEGEAASYEDEDSQESRRSERQGDDGPSSGPAEDDEDNAPYKSYGEDYEKEFEESYRKELPKNDYTHVKEVPDIEDPPSESRKRTSGRNRARSSRVGTKQKSRHVVRDDAAEPKDYESYKSHRYDERPKSAHRENVRSKGRDGGKSKGGNRDAEGHGTSASWRTAGGAEAPATESYGHKLPRDRGTSRYRNDNAESGSARDERKKPRKQHHKFESGFNKSSRQSAATEEPVTGFALPAFESVESQTAPSNQANNDRKSDTKFFGAGDSFGAFTNPRGLRFFAKGPLGRGLSGI